MKYIVTAHQMKEYDNNTIKKIGIPALVLMERAALSMQEVIQREVLDLKTALIVCGVGNNGADGLALARLLCEQGACVTVCICADETKASEQFRTQREILNHYSVRVLNGKEALATLEGYAQASVGFDVVTDAVFGVGLSREITGDYALAIGYMNNIRGRKVAADIPSGVHSDSGKCMGIAFRADVTVTFGFAKRGMYLYPGTEYCGRIEVADIGISPVAFGNLKPNLFVYDEEPYKLLPDRNPAGNKGTFGKVLVVAGFEKMAGAAVLCAKAALQSGAGMVKVCGGEENRGIIQSTVPEVLWGTSETFKQDIRWADVIVVGPGMGKSGLVKALLENILNEAEIPLVLDADALNLISEEEDIKALVKAYPAEVIMTPHMGELSRLLKAPVAELKTDIFEVAHQAAMVYNAIMVCKDARTVVSHPDGRMYLNISGNAGMATAGSGDVLSGILGALMAQKKDAFSMATVGVYLHGTSGDKAGELYSEYGVTAGRIIENIE